VSDGCGTRRTCKGELMRSRFAQIEQRLRRAEAAARTKPTQLELQWNAAVDSTPALKTLIDKYIELLVCRPPAVEPTAEESRQMAELQEQIHERATTLGLAQPRGWTTWPCFGPSQSP
jgi:hypothetical protein